MGILDRFKSKKEQEISTPSASAPKAKGKDAGPKAVESTAMRSAPKKGLLSPDLVHILLKPLVTEKAAALASKHQYVFRVAMDANRIQVKNAVKALYGVTPTSVNIQRVRGKFVRFGHSMGQRQTWKKAIVSLPIGTTIDVHAGV